MALSDYLIRFLVNFHRDLEFSRSNMQFAISSPKMIWLSTNEKQTYQFNSRHHIRPSVSPWPWPWLIFQGETYNLLYLSQKWSDCHEMKSKHMDWILGLKWGRWVWPWPWPWPWIFKVKYVICYISAKNGPIGTKRKANKSSPQICDHWDSPSPWSWPGIIKVKYGICYILWQNDLIATKQKMMYWLNTRPQI